jgi:hypothetical protein
LALEPKFGPWTTSMKLSVSLWFSRSWTVGRTPWASNQLVARPLPVYKHRKTHIYTQTLNIHALSRIRTHDPGFRASEDSACLKPLGYPDRHTKYLCKLIWRFHILCFKRYHESIESLYRISASICKLIWFPSAHDPRPSEQVTRISLEQMDVREPSEMAMNWSLRSEDTWHFPFRSLSYFDLSN